MGRGPTITLSSTARRVIEAEAARHAPLEAGGILLGHREDGRIIVTHALAVSDPARSATSYTRSDIMANALLASFLDECDTDDPTGYVGEWHSHPSPAGPSPTDYAAMRAIAKTTKHAVALVVHIPGAREPFAGRLAVQRRLGRVAIKEAHVLDHPSLMPLPEGAIRADGPVFISYRHSDGMVHADAIDGLLRAAGLTVWRDRRDLPPGTTVDRLDQALTGGLAGAVLIVTPDIAHSLIVRERELPRLLQLDEDRRFSLCIANAIPQPDGGRGCDYTAPDRLLGHAQTAILQGKKQADITDPGGRIEVIRDLIVHRLGHIRTDIRDRTMTLRVQTRPMSSAADAGDDHLHLRIDPGESGRLPSSSGLEHLRATLPIVSDAIHSARPRTVRIHGGAHLTVALALGAALPETKSGHVEVVDVVGHTWLSQATPAEVVPALRVEEMERRATKPEGMARIAVLVSMTSHPDLSAFQRLANQDLEQCTSVAVITISDGQRIDPRNGALLSAGIAEELRRLSASHGRAEIHLAFHGPYTLAVLVGRLLNTLRIVAYEWDQAADGQPGYIPTLVLEPGFSGGPITRTLLQRDAEHDVPCL